MKRLHTFIICLIALVVSAAPANNTATLNFTFNFDFVGNPDLQNFFLYTGTVSSNYTSKVNIGTSTNLLQAGFPRKTRIFFNVTAMSTNGVEGDFFSPEPNILTFNKPTAVTSLKATQ